MTEAPNVIPADVFERVSEDDGLSHGSHYFLQLPAAGDYIVIDAMDGSVVKLEVLFIRHHGSSDPDSFYRSAQIYGRRRWRGASN
jgi:hypothetical protein